VCHLANHVTQRPIVQVVLLITIITVLIIHAHLVNRVHIQMLERQTLVQVKILMASYDLQNIIDCVSPCATCNSSSICTSCQANSYYNAASHSCTPCPAGTVSAGGTVTSCTSTGKTPQSFYLPQYYILACTSPCATCTSPTSCTSCIANYYYNAATHKCTPCASGYESAGGTVTSCTKSKEFDDFALTLCYSLYNSMCIMHSIRRLCNLCCQLLL